MEIGVRVPSCQPVKQIAEFAHTMEELGFDAIYVPDSQTFWRDTYLTLYACGLATERLALAPAVSNIITRHTTVLASLARTLDEAFPGRVRMGLGVGHSALDAIERKPTPGKEFREGIQQLQRLIRGETVTYGQAQARMRAPRPQGVPILVAATGPRNLRLAGAVGDGVVLLSGVAQEPLRASLAAVRQGAADAGRQIEDFTVTVSAHTMVTDDIERDARVLKPVIATLFEKGAAESLAAIGIHLEPPAAIPHVSPDLIHAEDWAYAVEVTSEWVSDADAVAFAQEYCLFGTPQQIIDRIQQLEQLGVTAIFMQHVGSWDLPTAVVESVGANVLPGLRGR